MAAQKGRELLLKRYDGAAYAAIGGLRAKRLSINGAPVDVSDSDSGGWRELLNGAGLKSVSFSGGGVYKDTAAEQAVLADVFADAVVAYQIIIPALGMMEGSFVVSSQEYSGNHNDELQFSSSFESSGVVAFTAA